MNTIRFSNPDQLYDHIATTKIDPATDSTFAEFAARVRFLRNPKVCKCKKGAALHQSISVLYNTIANSVANEPLRSIATRVLGAGRYEFATGEQLVATIENS